MKARAQIFTQLQHPTTIFGLPTLMAGGNAAVTFITWEFCLATGHGGLAPIICAMIFITLLLLSYRLARKDKHIQSVLITCSAFWGKTSFRTLLAGASPNGSRSKGGRS